MTPAGDHLAKLRTLRESGIEVGVRSIAGGGYRFEFQEAGGDWASTHPAHPGFSTPEEAIEQGERRIAEIRAAREEAHAQEAMHFFGEGKLVKDGADFKAQAQDGSWIKGSTPEEAVKKAKAFRPTGTPGAR